ncbi:MAG: transcriptional regulator, TetR family [Candidatus Angelobacter sp.]|nr:transcriptional regulator, TetR family [Candidatus Angelobacter sp.]
MSGKKTTVKARPKTNPKMDRRARRTRDALGDALIHLMQERPFNSITVQDVLARAEVGRSTFYTHYRDKNDLFLSDAEEFWEAASTMIERSGEESKRVAPVRELFTHVAEAKLFRDALVASGKVHDVMELGQGQFARAIERRLTKLSTTTGTRSGHFAAAAHALAGALFSSLSWWIDRGMPVSPAEMDIAFHRLVWCGVNAAEEKLPAKSAQSAAR